MNKVLLCATSDIEENSSMGFSPAGGPQQEVFIIRRDNQFYAYHNSCPHTGATLNWQDNQYLDIGDQYIQCAIHGALFMVENGYCLRGPCAKQSLTPANIDVIDESIYLLN
jgi:nitrite reductase/ring-hydroxylating ferredoxin subunit